MMVFFHSFPLTPLARAPTKRTTLASAAAAFIVFIADFLLRRSFSSCSQLLRYLYQKEVQFFVEFSAGESLYIVRELVCGQHLSQVLQHLYGATTRAAENGIREMSVWQFHSGFDFVTSQRVSVLLANRPRVWYVMTSTWNRYKIHNTCVPMEIRRWI